MSDWQAFHWELGHVNILMDLLMSGLTGWLHEPSDRRYCWRL